MFKEVKGVKGVKEVKEVKEVKGVKEVEFFNFLILLLRSNKSCSIVGLYPIDLEGVGVFGVFLQILLGQCLFYLFLVGWIDEGDDGSFETGS